MATTIFKAIPDNRAEARREADGGAGAQAGGRTGAQAGATRTLPAGLDGVVERLGRGRRILFAPGPGDVEGTWRRWRAGEDDPGIAALAYSAQVYELAARLGASLEVRTEAPPTADAPRDATDPVAFAHLPARAGSGAGHHLRQIRHAFELAREARRTGAELVICQRFLGHFWPLAAARLGGTRLVISLHNGFWPAHRGPNRLERAIGALNGLALRLAGARVICVSEAVREQALRIGLRAEAVDVHIPQYAEPWRDAWTPRLPDRPLRRLVYAGRIEADKGVFDLLGAFAGLARAHPELRLEFLGAGSKLEALREAARAAGLEGRADFAGHLPGDALRARLADADLLVCPTGPGFSEGLAKTPIEAALLGVPALLSDGVPCAALLAGATETFRAGDAADLEARIAALIAAPARLAAMNAAAERLRERFFDRRLGLGARLALAADAAFEGRRTSPARSLATEPPVRAAAG
ncbi:Glycosyltransferase involved in cell wall bisynthesis [Albimonas donghaensis]|uniref:Glycosyltransferase involved in cell wall bisynthesis n=1 Tax=Albimonas donghaensis TaxID=356660 RepID=A0A1H3FM63_9RHOB|nr:glycosyltransferase family 4 protein [Albimonas donghaensis]SDX92086.1 Glycosyltransferase involved in cell wall bisynthesis [Albimonas donghaensis]